MTDPANHQLSERIAVLDERPNTKHAEYATAAEKLTGETRSAIERLQGETRSAIERLQGETRAAIGRLQGETRAAIGRLEGETRAALERLRTDIERMHVEAEKRENRKITAMFSCLAVIITLLALLIGLES